MRMSTVEIALAVTIVIMIICGVVFDVSALVAYA